MRAEIEDFGTGWYEISIGINKEEIQSLINYLNELQKDDTQHFHLSSDLSGDGVVCDIEIYVNEEGEDNLSLSGLAIKPTR
ncbi:hypothetical protein [Oceanidesulfovibrio marinus]|uniref:Uncharacterized protein n=1 Tax=Oceanidesulfovibrio marinus TaxID=370038 RepID=A0ABX6NHH1_9BACT|nr:hypothetical protein [Oceanidesulfovibrio marinus]QJT09155.1 hypothetical protein E8L03_09490 [Oceanidesulfovibrio marinus]